MHFLKQVINLLSKYEVKADLFNEQDSENTAFHTLFAGVKEGKYSTDEDAACDIYRVDSPDARYRNLKSRLKKKLANHLFFLNIEQPAYSESLTAKYDVERLCFIMKTLSTLGATIAANEIAQQVLSISQKFHFTKAAVDSLMLLREHASVTSNHKDFSKYSELLRHYLDILTAELQSLEIMQKVNLHFTSAKSTAPSVLKEVEQGVELVSKLWNTYQSFTLFLHNLRAHTYLHQLRGDYNAAYQVCVEAESFFKNHPHLSTNARRLELAMHKSFCLFYLRRYDDGIMNAKNHFHLFSPGSGNWFTFMQSYFQLLFHGQYYEDAKAIYESAVTNINFDIEHVTNKEMWKILGLYLAFVEGRETPDMDQFMKDMEVYKHDKSGVYVAVLALSVVLLLRNGEYDKVVARDEYIKKYLTRYLKNDDHVRSTAFFKLLRLVISKDFRLDAVLKIGQKYIDTLNDRSLRLDDYEVMPYERMWDYVVEALQQHPHNTPTNGVTAVRSGSSA